MHGSINVKSPNNISEWQMGFNSAFKGLIMNLYRSDTFSPILKGCIPQAHFTLSSQGIY